MDYRITLRGELEKAIDETGCTLSQLEEKGGTQIGNLSACLRGKTLRPITMKQLDKLTEVLGLPEGYYYEFYLAECFYKDRVARSRMESFLFRCVELGKTDLIMKAINILVEHPKYTELLFSVAEKLYLSGYAKESVFFYEEVIEGEKYNHSERIAISHYRIFRASIGSNAKENYKAVIRFESFRNKLPEGFQLDALLQLVNVCYTLEFWPMVEQFAEELRALSNIVYLEELRKLDNNRSEPPIETERHLVVYYGKSYLMKSLTLSKQGRYEEAKACIKGYEDLGWFKLLDDLGKKEVAKYSQFAKGNRYCIELLLGNTDMLDEFINFLTDHPTHTSGALLVILEAANTYRLNIDHILERFAEAYPQTSHQSGYLLIGILGFIIKKRFISLIGSCMKKGWKLFYIVFPCLFRPINIANH
ncbi:DNA-binding protein [Paenibacillus larvae]|uniref:DNA-binding protein n=3 Tax=Paenibacillus larvae TaxID=1464 RepID=A0AAP5MW27_9BACL|nr:hypothetical protein [Paenibacillus larvae]AVG11453.1 putative DNA-binding protein [Paenibacillus larvae subsp. larvae DSM 25430]AVF23024.1 putative DNA-binding protein [Paenibacillus larvae subsp. larvae]ETK26309.1 putative DNA-binding protein [Paenibacillus larvae subsp. larvae DSM 25719]MCY7478926.1 DNA-binding protein [Paenibacillus larvae]MCY7491981.1 DNA-binding protein [Paenibacillus larvae]